MKSHGTGRVWSGGFQISRVGTGCPDSTLTRVKSPEKKTEGLLAARLLADGGYTCRTPVRSEAPRRSCKWKTRAHRACVLCCCRRVLHVPAQSNSKKNAIVALLCRRCVRGGLYIAEGCAFFFGSKTCLFFFFLILVSFSRASSGQ